MQFQAVVRSTRNAADARLVTQSEDCASEKRNACNRFYPCVHCVFRVRALRFCRKRSKVCYVRPSVA